MTNLKLSRFFPLYHLCLTIALAFSLTSCIFAQTNSFPTNSPQTKESNGFANKQTGDSSKLQSVKSCKVLNLPPNFSTADFDPIGGYKIYGKSSEVFEEFNNFTLDKVFDKNSASATDKIVGGVVINIRETSPDTYQIDQLFISSQKIQFSTESLNKTRYEFDGRFLKKGAFSRYNEKNIPVLKGVLKRFESEKLTAEKELKFRFVVWKAKFPVPNC